MTERVEQRICIKFCLKLGDTQSETIEKIKKAFGDNAMGVTQIKEWYRRFKDGRTSSDSNERCGRPSTSRNAEMIEEVRKLVMEDRRITIREIASDVGISFGSVQAILTDDLSMRRVAAKFVPKLLTKEQLENRLDVARDMLECANQNPNFMKEIITGDESWVYGYDPETKAQSSQWKSKGSPRPKKARQVRSKVKVMLTVFFDHQGVVHHEYAPAGQTINKEYYLQVLRRLRDAVRRKRPLLWQSNDWRLHHDNAPAHSSHLIQDFLAKHGIPQVRQSPYSPDMAPCDFWLFPKLKMPLKGSRFEDTEEIKTNATKHLLAISKSDYEKCFQQWEERWNKCVKSEGAYFEGD